MPEKVFTYGTLRPDLYPHVPARFKVVALVPAVLANPAFLMYHLGGYPALVKDEAAKAPIQGFLVETEDLKRLDGYEGYRADGTGLYDRMKVTVATLVDGTSNPEEAWVYFMRRAPGGDRVLASGDWAEAIRRA